MCSYKDVSILKIIFKNSDAVHKSISTFFLFVTDDMGKDFLRRSARQRCSIGMINSGECAAVQNGMSTLPHFNTTVVEHTKQFLALS